MSDESVTLIPLMMMFVILTLLAVGVFGYLIYKNTTDNGDVDRWDDIADQLQENGGRINYYYGDHSTGHTFSKECEFIALNDGLMVISGNSTYYYQYDRIYNVQIG